MTVLKEHIYIMRKIFLSAKSSLLNPKCCSAFNNYDLKYVVKTCTLKNIEKSTYVVFLIMYLY